jgi:hypothetical protein
MYVYDMMLRVGGGRRLLLQPLAHQQTNERIAASLELILCFK